MSLEVGGSSTWMLFVIEKGIGVKRKIAVQLPKSSAEMGKRSKINQIKAMKSSDERCGQTPLASGEEGFHTHEDEQVMVWKELGEVLHTWVLMSLAVWEETQLLEKEEADPAVRSLKLYSQECPAQW